MSLRQITVIVLGITGTGLLSTAQADPVSELLQNYKSQGAGPFSSDAGESLLRSEGMTKDGKLRNCTSCHGEKLTSKGEHIVTGKTIQPLAPSANPERLTDRKKIEKWFRRNCKWTFGRECTAQEKGDFLSFLKTQ